MAAPLASLIPGLAAAPLPANRKTPIRNRKIAVYLFKISLLLFSSANQF